MRKRATPTAAGHLCTINPSNAGPHRKRTANTYRIANSVAGRPDMKDQLALAALHRIGSANHQKRERHSFDFVVNGVSLFEAAQASKYDMCGSLSSPQFEPEVARLINKTTAAMLTSDVPVGGHRVPLFVCPECGDLACGAVTARVSRTEVGVQWSDFTYENGFDATVGLGLGPFEFERVHYLTEIERAKAD